MIWPYDSCQAKISQTDSVRHLGGNTIYQIKDTYFIGNTGNTKSNLPNVLQILPPSLYGLMTLHRNGTLCYLILPVFLQLPLTPKQWQPFLLQIKQDLSLGRFNSRIKTILPGREWRQMEMLTICSSYVASAGFLLFI